ncbi:type II toxin-antitoxin system RelE/ParE family toxin [Nonomuraea sp. NPDC050383]|uniref:type II toxin-antitoxin system RelE/ParE family toxin n=1 Tax=Nonomuraea sp. NPDC050383 TaxID=3364362 RepID=UPI0037BC823A
MNALDERSRVQVVDAIDRLAEAGPSLGRPLVDKLQGSQVHNLKELRPGPAGSSEIRILFVFDPWRSAILLVGGDESGDWSGWYRRTIPRAEELYAEYLTEREAEEKDRFSQVERRPRRHRGHLRRRGGRG